MTIDNENDMNSVVGLLAAASQSMRIGNKRLAAAQYEAALVLAEERWGQEDPVVTLIQMRLQDCMSSD